MYARPFPPSALGSVRFGISRETRSSPEASGCVARIVLVLSVALSEIKLYGGSALRLLLTLGLPLGEPTDASQAYGFHSDRTVGGDCHYRGLDWALASRRAKGPRGCVPHSVHQ